MTTPADTLTPLDASFLYMETDHTPMHMGFIGIFEGGPLHDARGCLRLDELRAEVQSRLHLVPKLRKIVRFPALGESAPVWVDDPDFDITNHIHQAALPGPGSETQLLELCARLVSGRLDRTRPLWDIWLIDGLEGGRVALLEMLHHSMADGLAGVELATVLLDLEPRSPAPHAPTGGGPLQPRRGRRRPPRGRPVWLAWPGRSPPTGGTPCGTRTRRSTCWLATRRPSAACSRARPSRPTARSMFRWASIAGSWSCASRWRSSVAPSAASASRSTTCY